MKKQSLWSRRFDSFLLPWGEGARWCSHIFFGGVVTAFLLQKQYAYASWTLCMWISNANLRSGLKHEHWLRDEYEALYAKAYQELVKREEEEVNEHE